MSEELSAADLIQKIDKGELPTAFMMFAAQGMLPLEQEEMVAVLAHLSQHSSAEIAEVAKNTIAEQPSKVLVAFARSENAEPRQLLELSRVSSDPAVLEAVVRNRQTEDEAIEELARRVGGSLQEVIVINQERIIRHPAILDALLENPAVTPDVKRRALEHRDEFFDKVKVREAIKASPELLAELDLDDGVDTGPIEELLDKAENEVQEADTLVLPAESDGKKLSLWKEIAEMTVAQRVQVAFKGGKTARGILIRDRNKLVCTAVVRSPRITETEIEAFSAMRNIEDEVLRIIATKREYTSKYPIVLNLVRNPKVPVGVVMPLISRLTLKDMKSLASDKGISEAVRVQARKTYQARTKNN
jgi:hypothetical protein